jgi:ELWxxDGT repeat protein
VEDALSAADRARIAKTVVTVSGDETFSKTFDGSLFKGGAGRVHYVPGIAAGTLTFTVDGLATDNSGVSSGTSGPVALVAGKAVAALVTMGAPVSRDAGADLTPASTDGPRMNSVACSANADCVSGFCTDGVCCDKKCDGSCQACNLAAKPGICSSVVNAEDDTCKSGNSCDAMGMCKKTNGQTCGGGTECASTFCADGVCCDKVCNGVCQSCAIKMGTCSPVINDEDDTCKTSSSGVFVCDGTGQCTQPHLVKDINTDTGPANNSDPHGYAQGPGSLVFFAATIPTKVNELWITDGTASGTKELIAPTTGGNSDVRELTLMGNAMYFAATATNGHRTLWKSDGTFPGTNPVRDIMNTGTFNADPSQFTVYNNKLYFVANGVDPTNSAITGYELWVSDGSLGGTMPVKDLIPGTDNQSGALSSSPTALTVFNNMLFFAAYGSTVPNPIAGMVSPLPADRELWRFDGTNTMQVTDINAGTANAFAPGLPNRLFVIGNLLYFGAAAASGTIAGNELWRSDGSLMNTSSTYPITDVAPGAASSDPAHILQYGNYIYFSANDGTTGREWWRTDGAYSPSVGIHTFRITDVNPGAKDSIPIAPPFADPTIYNNELYWSGIYSDGSRQLLKIDATNTVTKLNVNPLAVDPANYANSDPAQLTVFANKLFFRGTTAISGQVAAQASIELWFTDGTTTARACQTTDNGCYVNPSMGIPALLTPIGNKLYFAADKVKQGAPTGSIGQELFSFP